MSHPSPGQNSLSPKELEKGSSAPCTNPCTSFTENAHETPPEPPADLELARLTAAWPALPEPIRLAILALVEVAAPQANNEGSR